MIRQSARVLALVLALSILFPVYAYAAMPNTNYVQDSDYISNYAAFVATPGNYEARVWFNVTAVSLSDEVGVLTVVLQKSDDRIQITNVKTFQYTDYPNMIEEDTFNNHSYVSQTVDHGHYYRAWLTVYVANNGGSDSRYCVTEWFYI